MKQRLLLSLLMLFVSVGLVKAAVKITIPKGSGTVTVTFTSTTYNQFSPTNYPRMYLSDGNPLTTLTANGSTVTYTYTPAEGSNGEMLTFYTSNTPNVTYKEEWKDLTIAVNGKVTSFEADGGDFLKQFVGISFTNNGELSKLVLGASAAQTGYFPNLTSLSCAGNKLNVIPAKPKDMKASDYNIGEQSPAETKIVRTEGNAKSFTLSTEVFNGIFAKDAVTKGTDLAIQTLKDEDGNVTTAVKADLVNSVYHFRDANGVYVDGDFKADIKISESNASYPGVVICNVPLTVTPALFNLDFTYDQEHGNSFKIEVNGVEKTVPVTGLKKGDVITLTPIPNEDKGYEFTGVFEWNQGVGDPVEEGNHYKFTVAGNIDPVIKATFKLKGATVTWNTTTTDGIIRVTKNGQPLNNGDAVTVNDEIRVYVKANEGKTIDKVKMSNINDADIKDTDDYDDVFDATVKVPAAGTNIVVTFAATSHQFTLRLPEGPANTTITIQDATGKVYGSPANTDPKSDVTATVPAGTKLTITFPVQDKDGKYVGSVLVNGSTIPTEMTEKGTYVIKDFEMPNHAVTMTANVTVKQKLTVELDENITYTYNGDEQPVQYVVKNESGAVVNVSGITVYYGKTGDNIASYKANSPFTNANADGESYSVYFKREADDTYAEINTSVSPLTPETYTIAKAPLVADVKDLKVSVDATTKKYKITGGKIGYMVGNTFKEVTGLGEFGVLSGGSFVEDASDAATVVVSYQFKADANLANYDISAWQNATNNVTVPVEGKDAETITVSIFDNDYDELLVLKNGGAVIKNGDAVPVGSTITMGLTVVDDPNDKIEYAVTITDSEGNVLSDSDNLWRDGSTFTVDADKVKNIDKLIFKLEVKDSRTEIKVAKASEEFLTQGGDEKNPTIVYNGKAQAFDASQLTWVKADGEAVGSEMDAKINAKAQISYTIDGEVLTSAPVDAGTYTVTLTYDLDKYIVQPIQATLIIHKAEFTDAQVPTPSASRVALGQTLNKSNLSGQATIEGTYEWDEEQDAALITVDPDKKYKVKFVPAKNYKEAQLEASVPVEVTNNPIITFDPNPEGGKVTVVNKNDPNDVYKSGDEVFAGTELVITATPNEDFAFERMVANGVSVPNPYTVTFDKTTIEIETSFHAKTTVLPGNFKVTIPEGGVRGAIITGGGDHVVAQGGSISFTVSTLAADANKVSVTATNGTVSKGSNGRYTVSNIQANTTVRVSLSNPTALKVDIKESYLNDKKYHIGYVEIADGEATTYYYGDEITVVAYPESGVKFKGWSNGSTDQVLDLTLTGDLTLTASFTGTPTGIEDIETAKVYTGKGFIMVKNVANAEVTVVSISGRLQAKREISGDTQIMVPQGIYVVVLQSGDDTKQLKVIVK